MTRVTGLSLIAQGVSVSRKLTAYTGVRRLLVPRSKGRRRSLALPLRKELAQRELLHVTTAQNLDNIDHMLKRALVSVLLLSLAGAVAWYLTQHHASVFRGYVADSGQVVTTNTPDVPIAALAWLPVSLLAGWLSAYTLVASKKRPAGWVASLIIALVLLYGGALLTASQVGMAGFFGLLGYHGAGVWSLSRVSFYLAPLLVALGILFAAVRYGRKEKA